MAGAWARSGGFNTNIKGRSPYMIPLPRAGNAGYAWLPLWDSFRTFCMKNDFHALPSSPSKVSQVTYPSCLFGMIEEGRANQTRYGGQVCSV